MSGHPWNNKSFCPLPWTSIYLQPDGKVDSCCVSKNNLGNLQSHSIDQIVNERKNIEIKKKMTNNIVPDGCKICHLNETGNNLDRSDYSNSFKDWYKTLLADVDKNLYSDVNNFKLHYFDLRLKNTCNYGCVYCGPKLSSVREMEELNQPQIASGRIFSHGIDPIIKINDNQIKEVYQFFEKNAKDLKVFYLAGGEPLYIKENLYFLEKLYQVNPDCQIIINTNLSLVTNNKIYDTLTKFKNTYWIVSVDDIGERYNYIRYQGNWEIFLKNLLALKDTVGEHKISLSMVYCSLNAKTIFDCIDYFSDLGFVKNQIGVRYISSGEGIRDAWDPRGLPQDYLDQVILLIEKIDTGNEKLNSDFKSIKSILKSEFNKNEIYSVFTSFERFDKMRGTNSREVFPDIYQFAKN